MAASRRSAIGARSSTRPSVAKRASSCRSTGSPSQALSRADDVERLAELDAQRARDFEILDRVGQAFRDQSPEEIQGGRHQGACRSQSRKSARRRFAERRLGNPERHSIGKPRTVMDDAASPSAIVLSRQTDAKRGPEMKRVAMRNLIDRLIRRLRARALRPGRPEEGFGAGRLAERHR